MSIAPDDAAPQPERLTTPTPAPADHPRLPIVEFHLDEERPLSVHFAAAGALQAAHDNPTDDFLDLRGKVLRLAKDDGRGSRLVAGKEGDEDGMRRRVLAALRRAAELQAGGGPIDIDVEPILGWLADAPDLTHLVHALALAETEGDDPGDENCIRCTWIQQMAWGSPRCCPR